MPITLRLHSCPEGFDGITATIYDFAQYCHTPMGGINITVQFNGLAPTIQTDIDGNWSFNDATPAASRSMSQCPILPT